MTQCLFRSQPHPLTLFSLIPLQTRTAEEVLHDPDNQHLVSVIPNVPNPLNVEDDALGINIGFHIGSKSSHTIATIGRNGDVTIRGASISRIQCSFEINVDTQQVLLCDRSSAWTTQTYGTNAASFEWERPNRRVVITKGINENFSFGGVSRDLFRFRIHWHEHPPSIETQIALREDHPRLTRTVDDQAPTALPSRRMTRIHTPSRTPNVISSIRYHKKTALGVGTFGEVWKVVDIDNGRFLAVKLVRLPGSEDEKQHMALKREVTALQTLRHPHVVELVSAQKKIGYLELFTLVKDGSVEDLIKRNIFKDNCAQADILLHHMLKALDYLDSQNVIHRDVKPANILYVDTPNDGRVYQLADFGLCSLQTVGQTQVGTPWYMAPEMWRISGEHTSKVDIWSLFVTIGEALDVGDFQQKREVRPDKLLPSIQEMAQSTLQAIKDMALIDPEERASAGIMLDKLFDGNGRSSRQRPKAAIRVNTTPVLTLSQNLRDNKRGLLGRDRARGGRRKLL